MSKPTIKITIPASTTDEITRYIEAEAAERAPIIAAAIRDAVDNYDYHTEIARICQRELDKFVATAASNYFRELLTNKNAYQTIRTQIRGGSNDDAPTTE